ncbi:MAG: TIGR02466 family protein [Alphaproteobacteria bacterium]|nr:TIGR02466 family protein [Alphaproteobacteria bacterium]
MIMREPGPSPQHVGPAAGDALDIGKSFGMIFGTPLAVHYWPESEALNAELQDLILAKEPTTEGLSVSNIGGWHSPPDFFHWDADCVRVIEDRVRQLFTATSRAAVPEQTGAPPAKYWIEGWVNVNRDGSYNKIHNHTHAIWSGTYYVSMGEPEGDDKNNGALEFIPPSHALELTDLTGKTVKQECLVTPGPGVMVLFPAWLLHQVRPFRGKGTRISIAFNISMPKGMPPAWAK